MDSVTEEISRFADRRSALRQNCRVQYLTLDHSTAGKLTAIVLDLSREGFRLVLPVAIPCGEEVVIHPPEGMDLLKIRATIVRQSIVMFDGKRSFECGVEVADTAAWRKHTWFLTLRTGSEEYEAAQKHKAAAAA